MILAGFLVVWGLLFSYLLPIKASFWERFFLGLSIGLIFFSTLTFWFALLIGLRAGIILGLLAFIASFIGGLFIKRNKLKNSLRETFPKVSQNKALLFLLVVLSLAFAYLLDIQVLHPKSDDYYCGFLSYGDLPAHLALVTNFVYGNNFPPQNPFFSGIRLAYPFLADFLSAIFVFVGNSLRISLIIPSFIFFVSFVGLTYSFGKSFFEKSTALLSTIIFFLGTNLGHLYFFRDLWLGKTTFLRAYLANPKPYGGDFNIHLYNPMINLFVAERPFLPGLILGVTALVLLYRGLKNKKISYFLWAGLFAGILPLWHAHTFLSLVIFSSVLFFSYFPYIVLSKKKKSKLFNYLKPWLTFFLLMAILCLPQAFFLLPQVAKTHFFHLQFGWMKGEENFFLYWFKNGGLTLILAIICFFFLKGAGQKFFLAAFLLFFIANIIIFQPWDYDNIKVFTFVFWFFSLLAAAVIRRLANFKIFGKILVVSLIFLIIFNFFTQFYLEKPNIKLYSNEEIESASWVIYNTDPQSVFVIPQDHRNFIPSLAGRRVFMGYIGYLWTQGVVYSDRERLLPIIYQGGEVAERTIDQFSLDYLLFSPGEIRSYQKGYNYYRDNFQLVRKTENYTIFKINDQIQ